MADAVSRGFRHLAAALLLVGCSHETPAELIFVRHGVIVSPGKAVSSEPGSERGHRVGGERVLIERDWTPGEQVTVAGVSARAPRLPECVPLFSVELGDVSRWIAMGGTAPDTALAWSPSADRLAVGSYLGEVRVLDGWTGEVLARRKLSETLVKAVAWSSDGRTLYAGEQSPDAFVRALDPVTLADRWKVRLADIVGTSPAPTGEDLYGVYALPGAYGLVVLPDGDLLVAAVHGWSTHEGRRNRSQLLRIRDGRIRARWPAQPADATFWHPRVTEDGGLVAVPVGRSADGPAPSDLPIGGVGVLRLDEDGFRLVAAHTIPPLAPWFKSTFIWEAIDLTDQVVLMGTGDGRVRVDPVAGGEPVLSLTTGAPVMAGDVPIVASVGSGFLHRSLDRASAALQGARAAHSWEAVFATSGTNIPYGAAAPDLRPPSTHPNENAIWDYGLDGELRWTWRGEQRIQGLSPGPDGRTLVVGAGDRVSDQRRDLYGALVFDLGGPERSGDARLVAFCPTEGPVFFRQAPSRDGRIAVAEHPYRTADGSVEGQYQVTVLR